MKLSELIAAYGDDKVQFQNLDQSAISMNMNGATTKITFGTEQRLHLDGTEKLGLVVWMDRERVKEIVAASKETPQANDVLERAAASIAAMIHDWYKDGTVASIPESTVAKRLSRFLPAAPSPSSEAVGWRPIETAPKDGTRFLAYTDDGIDFFHWQDHQREGSPVGWRDSFIRVYRENDPTGPEGWMPLPSAPVSDGGEHG